MNDAIKGRSRRRLVTQVDVIQKVILGVALAVIAVAVAAGLYYGEPRYGIDDCLERVEAAHDDDLQRGVPRDRALDNWSRAFDACFELDP